MGKPVRMVAAMVAGLALAGAGMAATKKPAPAKKPPAVPTRVNPVKVGVEAWGRGDYPAAVAAWRGPAVAGDADAQFNLGQAYKLGQGVPADLAQAEEWYRKAALQGHQQAEDNYGLALFMNGRKADAVPWLEKSSARGEPRAQYVLGAMLFNADGVPKDWVRAYALMTRSAATGLPQGVSTLAQMDRYIPADQRQQGQAMARRLETDAQAPQLAQAGPPPAAALPYAAPPARQIARAAPPPAAVQPPYAAPPVPQAMRETPLPPSAVAQPDPQPMMLAPAPPHAAPRARSGRPGTVRALPPPHDVAPERQPDVATAPPADLPGPAYAEAAPPSYPERDAPPPQARTGRQRDLPYTYTGPIPPAGQAAPGGYAATDPRAPAPAEYAAAPARTPPPVSYAAAPPRPAPPAPRAAPPPPTPHPVAASGRWRVQLGAFRERGNADALWHSLSQRIGAFAGRQPYMVTAGGVTRLQVGPFASSAEATRACAQVKPTGTACVVVGS